MTRVSLQVSAVEVAGCLADDPSLLLLGYDVCSRKRVE